LGHERTYGEKRPSNMDSRIGFIWFAIKYWYTEIEPHGEANLKAFDYLIDDVLGEMRS
jgi:hypothetical protein